MFESYKTFYLWNHTSDPQAMIFTTGISIYQILNEHLLVCWLTFPYIFIFLSQTDGAIIWSSLSKIYLQKIVNNLNSYSSFHLWCSLSFLSSRWKTKATLNLKGEITLKLFLITASRGPINNNKRFLRGHFKGLFSHLILLECYQDYNLTEQSLHYFTVPLNKRCDQTNNCCKQSQSVRQVSHNS